MRIVTIVQARMGSTRLPGKVLKDLGGASMLERVVNRARRCLLAEEIVVATTTEPADAAIVEECRRIGVAVFRGGPADVLDRYCQASRQARANAILRVTADCPFTDPTLLDGLLAAFLERRPDYASNCVPRSYPRGLDAEAMTFEALCRAHREATQAYQREHVTPYIYESASQFKLLSVPCEEDFSELRWTVDRPEDLEFARRVYLDFQNNDDFGWRDVLNLVLAHPQLARINQHVRQKCLDEA